MKKIVLIGGGGHCKVIIDIIKSIGEYEIIGITDKNNNNSVLGVPIIGDDNILQQLYNEGVEYAFIGIGALNNIEVRSLIYRKLKNIGFKLPVLIHKHAVVSQYSNIGEGTCVMAGAIINPGVFMGKNCIINTGSVIEHECKIGQNTHISPNSSIAGGVHIGSNAHVGIGSTIIEGKTIGDNVTIGAGAVVIDDIADNAFVVGIPAKIIRIKK